MRTELVQPCQVEIGRDVKEPEAPAPIDDLGEGRMHRVRRPGGPERLRRIGDKLHIEIHCGVLSHAQMICGRSRRINASLQGQPSLI
jgi:hypothetical protein